MSAARLALHQIRFDQKMFWRNPASVFFTAALPLIFLVIFCTVFGNDSIKELGGVKTSTYYVPAIITLAVVSATMQNLAVTLTIARENGILKRGRATPLPSWVFFAGRLGNAIVVSVLLLVVVTAVGNLVYGVEVPWDRLPAVLLTLAVGAAAFCCLGVAMSAAIPSQDAAPAIANVVLLPLYFISGVFVAKSAIPDGVLRVRPLAAIVLPRQDIRGSIQDGGPDSASIAAFIGARRGCLLGSGAEVSLEIVGDGV